MQVSHGAALAITAAYRNGIINFETYSAIKKKYSDVGQAAFKGMCHEETKSCFLRQGKYPE